MHPDKRRAGRRIRKVRRQMAELSRGFEALGNVATQAYINFSALMAAYGQAVTFNTDEVREPDEMDEEIAQYAATRWDDE